MNSSYTMERSPASSRPDRRFGTPYERPRCPHVGPTRDHDRALASRLAAGGHPLRNYQVRTQTQCS